MGCPFSVMPEYMPSIHCHDLGKTYRGTASLQNASLTLTPGSVTGLLGANGAGKSTLIKCILGLIRPDSGNIEGSDGASVGYLPELANLPASATAWQTTQLALKLSNNRTDYTASALLDLVCLNAQHWHKPLRHCSKGMRQRAALAYAIAGKPQWLILDEPMSGLDVMGRKQFLDILLDLNRQGVGMLVCSHIVPDLVRLCDRILLIHQGTIIDDVAVFDHSMEEAEVLESRLMQAAKDSHE